MEIRKNSWNVKFYMWFYKKYDYREIGNDFCPIFWKGLIAYIVTIIFSPTYIILLPAFLFKKFRKKFNYYGFFDSLSPLVVIGMITNFCAYLVFSTIYYLFLDSNNQRAQLGFMLTIALLCMAFFLFCIIKYSTYIRKKSRVSKEPKEPKKYIVVEAIKAFYYKYCPKITWKD